MKRTLALTGAMALVFAGLGASAPAAITYVDATHDVGGNTAKAASAGGGVFTTSGALNNQGPANDGLWDVRGFGNGPTIFQNASSGNVDNAHRLATSVSGLPAGTYNAFAYFWSDTSSWRLEASLTDDAGPLPLFLFNPTTAGVVQHYAGADGTVLSGSLAVNPFTTDVLVAEGNRRLLQAPLGTFTGTSVTVYVDDTSTQADSNQRSWYDGVGFELVPEPVSGALIAWSVVGLSLARRRRM